MEIHNFTPSIDTPKQRKLFGAFHLFEDSKDKIILGFNPYIVDSTMIEHLYTLKGKNTIEITCVVYSGNFLEVYETFVIEFETGNRFFEKFYKKGEEDRSTKACWEQNHITILDMDGSTQKNLNSTTWGTLVSAAELLQ